MRLERKYPHCGRGADFVPGIDDKHQPVRGEPLHDKALQVDREQQQGREAGLVRSRRLVPLEEPDSEIKDADPLLLLVGLTVVVHIEQPALQPLRAEQDRPVEAGSLARAARRSPLHAVREGLPA